MSSNVKPWLVLGIIFVAGIVTGVALTIGWGSHFMPPGGGQGMKYHWMMDLTQRLKLTPDQQAKIQPIVTEATTQIQSLHREEVERGSQIFKTANDQISAVLTPEQKVELQKMESEREKLFSGHMHHWGPPHDGPGDMYHHDGPDEGVPPPPPGAPTNAAPPGPAPQNP